MGQATSESGTGRKAQVRGLADQGLSVREIAERTGHPKSTVHRDLAGYEPTGMTAESVEVAAMKAEADRLTKLQHSERGTRPGPVVDGKRLEIPGPYNMSPERESRAARILHLRREAARIEHPLPTT